MDIILIEEREEEERQVARLSILRNRLRNECSPFYITSDAEFIRNFRLNKDTAARLINCIGPHLKQKTSVRGLSAELKILCTLRFLATGSKAFISDKKTQILL